RRFSNHARSPGNGLLGDAQRLRPPGRDPGPARPGRTSGRRSGDRTPPIGTPRRNFTNRNPATAQCDERSGPKGDRSRPLNDVGTLHGCGRSCRPEPDAADPANSWSARLLILARERVRMKKEMLINVMQPEECRIAIVEDGVLEELYVERTSQESYVGNIYKGR